MSRLILYVFIFCMAFPDFSFAQKECMVNRKTEDGTSFEVIINGVSYLAMPQKDMININRILKERNIRIESLETEKKAQEKLIEEYKKKVSADNDLITLQKELIHQLNELKTGYQELNSNYTAINSRYNGLTDGYEEIADNYKDISEKYRELVAGPSLSIDIGIGMSHRGRREEESSSIVLLGAGARRIKLWGFWQDGGSGAILGVNFPVF